MNTTIEGYGGESTEKMILSRSPVSRTKSPKSPKNKGVNRTGKNHLCIGSEIPFASSMFFLRRFAASSSRSDSYLIWNEDRASDAATPL